MNSQIKKGSLDMIILEMLYNKEMYGYEVSQYIEEYIKVKQSSVYIILVRLSQNKKLITREEQKGKRTIKYYTISEEGKEYLKELKDQWEEINNIILEIRKERNE